MKTYTNIRPYVIDMAKPYKWAFIGMMLIGIYTAIHNSIQPYALKLLIDTIKSAPNNADIIQVSKLPAAVVIALTFVIIMIWRLYNYLVLISIPQMKADIVRHASEYLRGQSFKFFQNNLSGSLSSKISDLTDNLQGLINSVFNISRQALTAIVAVAMACSVHFYFAIVFLIIAVSFLYMAYYCSNAIEPYAKAYAQSKNKSLGTIVDCFANSMNMLLFARENYEKNYLNDLLETSAKNDQSMQIKNLKNATILSLITWSLQAISIVLLIYLASKGLVGLGDFVLIFLLSITVIEQMWALSESLLTVGEQVGICNQALLTIYSPYVQYDKDSADALIVKAGKIEFKNVNFSYNDRDNLFSGMNLEIKNGEKVGLVGYSGVGKSTIANLVTRLFDINSGDILVDGCSIFDITRTSLRENISFIPQEPSLLHRSIMENIRYGKINATPDEIIEAAKKSHAHEFISNLEDGYQTVVGERGVKLSGGQRQRIAIARAILKNAPILILDEATSSLDSSTEKYIQDSLKMAMSGKTVIVIAHRLSTLLAMDKIIVLDNGKIVESGSHTRLMKSEGVYRKLWDTQTGHSFI